MNETLLNNMAVGFVGGMAILGMFSVLSFVMDTLLDWGSSNRKINTDVPELKDAVRDLKLKVSFLESDVKRRERSRRGTR